MFQKSKYWSASTEEVANGIFEANIILPVLVCSKLTNV